VGPLFAKLPVGDTNNVSNSVVVHYGAKQITHVMAIGLLHLHYQQCLYFSAPNISVVSALMEMAVFSMKLYVLIATL